MKLFSRLKKSVFPFLSLSLFVFLSSQIVFAAPSKTDNDLRIYQTVPEGKSLMASQQFILIDDFNSGKFLNRRGAPWQTKAPGTGALDLSLQKDDARSQHRGYSMKADFHLYPKEKGVFQSFLERVDVSKARAMVIKVRVDMPKDKIFTGRFRVLLMDWKRRIVVQDITAFCPKSNEGWGEVILPMTRFREGLDLDQLSLMAFEIRAVNEEMHGSISVDEIAFFGFNDVFFESLRDNLEGFPRMVFDAARRYELMKKNDREMLTEIARDTWRLFEKARDKDTHLIVDHIRTGDASLAADYTSPTNISMDLLSIISAMDLGFITRGEAEKRVSGILKTLGEMKRYKGFFYNFYDTKKLAVTRSYVSSVDSGWLAISLVVVRQAFDGEIAAQASKFLNAFNFEDFLDPENNQLMVGFNVPPKPDEETHHYGMLVSEARATSFYAIGKRNIPKEHWWYLFRTPPKAWTWQNQKAKGAQKTRDNTDYFQGWYQYQGKNFVPSWGGSLFEFLMPALVLKERELAPEGLGLNNRIAVEIQRDYAKEKGYPVWGISPAATSSGRRWTYQEFGVKAMSVKGYRDLGVITPHVSFLALDSLPEEAIKNIRNLLKLNLYGEYGFYDSYNLVQKKANPQYLTLDQGMTLVALCNYLKDGAIQNRFHKDGVAHGAEDLLKESFFKS